MQVIDTKSETAVVAVPSVDLVGYNNSVMAMTKEVISTFIANTDRNASSLALYEKTLNYFFSWVAYKGKDISHLTTSDIKEYKAELLSGEYIKAVNAKRLQEAKDPSKVKPLKVKPLSPLTAASYLTSLRKLYAWLEGEKIYPNIVKPVETPSRKKGFIKFHLTSEQASALLEHYKSESLRNFAIINLMLRTGIREVELTRCNIGDLQFMYGRRVLLIQGKGHVSKDDFVILSDKAYQPLKEYLETRGDAAENEPLFSSVSIRNRGERLTTRMVRMICKEGLVAIGLDDKKYSTHSLRHTTAVTMLKEGGSIFDVMTALRHTNPNTTQIYLESIRNEQRFSNPAELTIDNAF